MVGAIVKRDILAHPVVTIRCFGWTVFIRAVLAGPNTTFLSLLTDTESLQPAPEGVAEFVARCVELELKASRIYETLARRFENEPPAHAFFASLARQENAHAQLLELAETAAAQERWNEQKATPWRDVVPRLEQHMAESLSAVGEVESLKEALQQVIRIESSEINDVFNGVIAASDSQFVRNLRAFRDVELRHLNFIGETIGRLESN